MKKTITITIISLLINIGIFAKLRVVTTYPYISDILQHIAKDKIKITTLAKGSRDPHFITPKPSYIAKLRKADLLIINGGQLEVGWVPPLIRQANNSRISPQSEGFLDLFNFIEPIEKPTSVSRANGDVHPDGNPHFILNPDNVPLISNAITEKLSSLDKENQAFYSANNISFKNRFKEKIKLLTDKMKSLDGVKVVQYHKFFNYFFHKFHLKEAVTIEPLPGIPPSSKHISKVIKTIKEEGVKFIIHDVYHSKRSSKYISEKSGAKFVVLPHDVNAVKEAKDIFSLFDTIVERLKND